MKKKEFIEERDSIVLTLEFLIGDLAKIKDEVANGTQDSVAAIDPLDILSCAAAGLGAAYEGIKELYKLEEV